MAEANGDIPDCENYISGREPIFLCSLNFEAVNLWHELDIFGREFDGYSGIPKPLKLESIVDACKDNSDPIGLKWRIMLLEERIYSKRVKDFNARAEKRNKGKK